MKTDETIPSAAHDDDDDDDDNLAGDGVCVALLSCQLSSSVCVCACVSVSVCVCVYVCVRVCVYTKASAQIQMNSRHARTQKTKSVHPLIIWIEAILRTHFEVCEVCFMSAI